MGPKGPSREVARNQKLPCVVYKISIWITSVRRVLRCVLFISHALKRLTRKSAPADYLLLLSIALPTSIYVSTYTTLYIRLSTLDVVD